MHLSASLLGQPGGSSLNFLLSSHLQSNFIEKLVEVGFEKRLFNQKYSGDQKLTAGL